MANGFVAESSTGSNEQMVCPRWDDLGRKAEILPFFNPCQEVKVAGFRVGFLTDRPKREKLDMYNPKAPRPEYWFDVVFFRKKAGEGSGAVAKEKYTWAISQTSLLMALRAQDGLKNKVFDVQLVPVEKDFREKHPKYKGDTRYKLSLVCVQEDLLSGAVVPEKNYTGNAR